MEFSAFLLPLLKKIPTVLSPGRIVTRVFS